MTGLGRYILIGTEPVAVDGVFETAEWGQWLENRHNRIIKQEYVLGGLCWVSTVFLALDHRFGPGRPLLFETMVFWEGEGGYETERCSTYGEAQLQHQAMLVQVSSFRMVCAWAWRMAKEEVSEAKRHWQELRRMV